MSTPSLQFSDVMTQTFRLCFSNLRAFFDLALIPTIISAALMLGLRLLSDGPASPRLVGLVKLLDLVPTAMFAVGWYRWILLGPPQASVVAGLGWSARETGFLREFAMIFGLPILLMAFFLSQLPDDMTLLSPAAVSALPPEVRALGILVPPAFIAAIIGMRLSFGLAAPAVDAPWRTSMAWRYSKGNALVSLGAVFVITMIGMIGELILVGLAASILLSIFGQAGFGSALVLWLILATISYFKLALVTATQAVIFRQLTGWRAGAALRPPPT